MPVEVQNRGGVVKEALDDSMPPRVTVVQQGVALSRRSGLGLELGLGLVLGLGFGILCCRGS